MSFFDKALNGVLDGIERSVVDQVREAAAAALEEYPGQDAPAQAVKPADWTQAARAVSFWRLFDLEGKRAGLRDSISRIANERASRDKTTPSLIRRAEESESELTELCERLLQAPDVVPYLCEGFSALETVKGLEKENRRLQKDAEAAEKEATSAVSVVGQAQRAEAERAELAGRLAEESARVAALQAEVAEGSELRFQAARRDAELAQAREALAAIQVEHQRTQNDLFELRASKDARASAVASDADEAAHEHEQALRRIRTLEHELRRTEQRLEEATATSGSDPSARLAASRTGPQLGETSAHTIKQQLDEIQRLQASEAGALEELQRAGDQLRHAERQLAELQADLEARPSSNEAAELRSRLRTAEALLDAQMEAEGSGGGSPTGELESGSPGSSLVATLQARNRRLVADNTSLRHQVEVGESVSRERAGDAERLAEKAGQQATLIARLERDLAASSRYGANAAESGERADNDIDAEDGEMLQIVTGQRDRFRKRVEELEQEAGARHEEACGSEARARTLEADNLALYERIRYLQRYQARQTAAGPRKPVDVDDAGVPRPTAAALSHRMSCGPLQLHLGGGASADAAVRSRARGARFSCLGGGDPDEEATAPKTAVEQRYSKAYESRLNPFAEFQANEREGRLPTHERALLSGSKMLLSNRAGRAFAVVYLIAVHMFLFCLVYYIIVASAS